jgi:hypothetical protein
MGLRFRASLGSGTTPIFQLGWRCPQTPRQSNLKRAYFRSCEVAATFGLLAGNGGLGATPTRHLCWPALAPPMLAGLCIWFSFSLLFLFMY